MVDFSGDWGRGGSDSRLSEQHNNGAHPGIAPSSPAHAALVGLRAAIAGYSGDGTEIETLRKPLHEFCLLSRRSGVPPERVVIQVKHVVHGLPLNVGEAATSRRWLQDRIIVAAIAAYYRDEE